MKKWKHLDLRDKDHRPREGALTAIWMRRKAAQPTVAPTGKGDYDIGFLETEGRKTFLRCARGTLDLAQLNRTHEIWWCPALEFDGTE